MITNITYTCPPSTVTIGAGLAAGLGIAAAVLPTATNAYATGRMNKKNRKFAEKMYGVQRSDALADWNMNNDYNTPKMQMSRFKDAGLNPNLIYGQGTEAAAPRSSQFSQPETSAPQVDEQAGTNAIGAYQKVRQDTLQRSILQQNLDNMKEQNTLIKNQQLDVLASVDNKSAGTETLKIQNKLNSALDESGVRYRTSLGHEINQSQNIQLMDDTLKNNHTKIAQENEQREATTNRIKSEIKSQEQQRQVTSFEIKLNKQGLTKNDPTYWRLLNEALDRILK